MEINLEFRLPPDTVTVPIARAICRDALGHLGVTRTCAEEVSLAVTEACANVVQHAAADQDYSVLVELDENDCHIRVVDEGAGFSAPDSEVAMPPPLDLRGRGLALMGLLVDRLGFESAPERGTVVHLHKRLELEAGSPLRALRAAGPA